MHPQAPPPAASRTWSTHTLLSRVQLLASGDCCTSSLHCPPGAAGCAPLLALPPPPPSPLMRTLTTTLLVVVVVTAPRGLTMPTMRATTDSAMAARASARKSKM